MFGTHDIWLFVISGLLLNITPGPDTLYIVGRSSTQGWPAGAVAALGIGAGTLIHICAAALGLSAILAASATAFNTVKIIGAIYLLYVGLGLIRSAGAVRSPAIAPDNRLTSMRGIFLQGFLTNVLNPKVALFFLAFLPQFVGSAATSNPLAFLFLGAIFDINGTLWNLLMARLAAQISSTLAPSVAFKQWFNRCVGGIFVLVGLRLALADDR
ncbi:MAG TPA: LysE family translocator [Steroidobacteraceae bacterium]|jgi:threonine/homoserine/homoserine lactone efflux protein|nr:LysE family translocator [Steroidobacteraceae bacterium]